VFADGRDKPGHDEQEVAGIKQLGFRAGIATFAT
jgi:hypothetical protein